MRRPHRHTVKSTLCAACTTPIDVSAAVRVCAGKLYHAATCAPVVMLVPVESA